MSEHKIQRISVTQNSERVRAEAIVLLGGETKTPQPGETLAATGDRAIAGLRKTLYAAGVPKRAIATAVKNVERK